MDRKNGRYALLEKYFTVAILIAFAFFLLFLIASGNGTLWLKVICAIFSLLIPLISLVYLYLVQEWRKKRSLWMTSAAAAIFFCTLTSLILQFPSPAP